MKKHLIAAAAAALIAVSAVAAVNAAETDQQVGEAVSTEETVEASYPEITGFSCTETGIRVNWKSYPNAARYGLFYQDESGWHGIASTTALSMEYDNLQSEKVYTFTVRALDKNYNFMSDFNRAGWSCTYIAPPVINTLKSAEDGVLISWNKVNCAQRYRVYRKDSNHGWARIGDTSDTVITDKNASSGTSYSYTVRTVTADGSSETSYYNEGRSLFYVQTPKVDAIINRSGSSVITWSACKGVRHATESSIVTKTAIGADWVPPRRPLIPTRDSRITHS